MRRAEIEDDASAASLARAPASRYPNCPIAHRGLELAGSPFDWAAMANVRRDQGRAKRELAAFLRRLDTVLRTVEERQRIARLAADLEAEAAILEAEADRIDGERSN